MPSTTIPSVGDISSVRIILSFLQNDMISRKKTCHDFDPKIYYFDYNDNTKDINASVNFVHVLLQL